MNRGHFTEPMAGNISCGEQETPNPEQVDARRSGTRGSACGGRWGKISTDKIKLRSPCSHEPPHSKRAGGSADNGSRDRAPTQQTRQKWRLLYARKLGTLKGRGTARRRTPPSSSRTGPRSRRRYCRPRRPARRCAWHGAGTGTPSRARRR